MTTHTDVIQQGALRLAWPLFVEWLLTVSIGMVDAMILGLVSDQAAAAVGAVNVVLILAITLLGTLANSGGIVLSQNLGAKRLAEVRELQNSLLLANLLLGGVLSLLLLASSPWLPRLLAAPAELHHQASLFVAIVGGGLMAQAMVWSFSSILNARGHTRYTMVNAIAMNLLNAGLSYYLVVNTHSGVVGVAAATVLARLLGALSLYLLLRLRLGIRVTPNLPWARFCRQWQQIIKIALPATLEPLSYYGNQAVLTLIIASLGVLALATKTYVLSAVALLEVGAFALAQAAQILTGHLVGAGRWQEADAQKWRCVGYALGFTLLVSLPALLWRDALLGLFTQEPEIIRLGSQLLLAALLVTLLKAYNFVAGSCLRAAGDAQFTASVSLLCMWVILIPLSYLLVFPLGYGLLGIWLALGIDELCRALLMGLRWHSGQWQHRSLILPS